MLRNVITTLFTVIGIGLLSWALLNSIAAAEDLFQVIAELARVK